MSKIILLSELQREEDYDTAFFLTYTINLGFFEAMILPRLRRLGVSSIGILIDQRGYQESLEHSILSASCGQDYILAPVYLPQGGIQHAKLLWLQKREKITAYIGSHNLTMPGYNDQTEITAKLISTEPSHTQALQQIYDTVSAVVPSCLYNVWQHIKPPTTHLPSNITMMSSLHRPLLDQLIEKVQSADEVRVVTPFLNAQALRRLTEGVHAKEIMLDLPQEGPDTPLCVTTDMIPSVHPRFLYGKRRLHAKAYQFKSVQTSSIALGSANCTQAALMRSVAQGGNLEFLLFIEEDVSRNNNYLDEEELDFRQILDVETFPYTGRDWTISSSETSILFIDEATYNDGVLTVKWRKPDSLDVEDTTLTTDTGESVYCSDQHQITIALPQAPRRITLEAIANKDFCTTHAWVINYTALKARAIEARQNTWIYRVATNNLAELPASVAIWLEQAVQEYLAIRPENDTASMHRSDAEKRRRKMKDFREVFSYSSDLELVRNTARSILESEPGIYNFDLLRMLLVRTNVEPFVPFDTGNRQNNPQPYTQRSKKAFNDILGVAVRSLSNLSKMLGDPDILTKNDFVIRLKIILGTVACICAEVKDSSIKEQESLVRHFLEFLKQLNIVATSSDVLYTFSIQGPLILCTGAIAQFAEKYGEYLLQLKELVRKLIRNDPRSILLEWERTCDTRGLQDIRTQIERHIFTLFEVTSRHLEQQVDRRWSCLLELQKADIASSTERENLYKRAEEKYGKDPASGKIWSRYIIARQQGRLPVIFSCAGRVCPVCHISLPDQKIQSMQRAEAVICDNCQNILVVG